MLDPPLDHEEVRLRRWERKMALVRELKPRPGICEYISEARDRGLAVAVVSTDYSEWIMTGLAIPSAARRLRLHRVRRRRPDASKAVARPVPRALRRLNLSYEEAVAIEDSPNGVRAAKAAGVFCVCYANAVTRRLDLSEADVVVDSLDELPFSEVLEMATARL